MSTTWVQLGTALGDAAGAVGRQLGGTFLLTGSSLFVGYLAFTLLLAAFLAVPRGRRRSPRIAVLARALFPRRLLGSASGRADLGWFLFSVSVFGLGFGWAMLSGDWIAGRVAAGWALIGHTPVVTLPGWAGVALVTVALFVAYDFAYWLDHWLSHKLPLLWQFHRVHHGAESLSLLTNFRVHPVDTAVFASIVALVVGTVAGTLHQLLGPAVQPAAIGGSNILVLVAATALTHLQHSHLWVTLGPRWSRLLLGPAHHQLHHSIDPRHYDRNFGNCLTLWDRLFGTFCLPAATREPLRFGLGDAEAGVHGLRGAVVTPLTGAAKSLGYSAAKASSRSRAWRAHISA